MAIAKVTRLKNGLNTGSPTSDMESLIHIDPTLTHQYLTDFDSYAATDWVVTEVGSATQALADEDGGVLLVTNAAADDNSSFQQWAGGAGATTETFLFETSKKLWFKARFKVSDATQSDFIFGLQITDTSPLDVTDGVFFQKDDGDANLDFNVEKDDTATSSTAIHTMVDDTYIVAAFFYDGDSSIDVYIDDAKVATSVITNLPDDEELTISFGIQNGEAVAKTMSIDYIFVAKER